MKNSSGQSVIYDLEVQRSISLWFVQSVNLIIPSVSYLVCIDMMIGKKCPKQKLKYNILSCYLAVLAMRLEKYLLISNLNGVEAPSATPALHKSLQLLADHCESSELSCIPPCT